MTAETRLVVVLAAGIGERVSAPLPKQFIEVSHTPMLTHTLMRYQTMPNAEVIVVHHPKFTSETASAIARAGIDAAMVPGGSTRRASVASAVHAADGHPDERRVVLQNAASPNTPVELVERCLAGLDQHDVVQAYVPAVDTVFRYQDDRLLEILPRHQLGYTVDPTVYRLGTLRAIVSAYAADELAGEMTLDSARRMGCVVALVRSPETNVKLTTAADLPVLTHLLGSAVD